MSDLQVLFCVLLVLYAWECACWIRRGSVVFRTWLGKRWYPQHPHSILGNARGGFVFAPPLPPLGHFLVAGQLPVSISPEAVLAHVAVSVNPGGRPPQPAGLVPWADAKTIQARGKKVLINGSVFVKTGSPGAALGLTELLRRLAQMPSGKRAQALQAWFAESLDTKKMERRWRDFQRQLARLRLLTNLLFVFLFIATPLSIHYFGLSRTWALVLGILLLGTVSVALTFRRIHLQLHPEATDERFSQCLMMALYPALAIRAADLLSRPLLESFHPLALARVFCPDAVFRQFASQILRELRYPALPLCPRPEPLAQEAERHSRQALLTVVEALLQRSGLKPEELLAAPAPADGTCRSFCPRCLAQFTTAAGQCADCGGVALCALPAPGAGGGTRGRAG